MLKICIDSSKTIVMSFTQLVTGLVVSILWARSLGPSELGHFTFFLVLCSTIALAVNPGLYAAANFFLSTSKLSIKSAWTTVLVLSLVSGFIGSILLFISLLVFTPTSEPIRVFLMALIVITALVINANFSGLLYGVQRINQITICNIAFSGIYFLGTITLVLVLKEVKWTHAAGVYAACQVLNAAGMVVLSRLVAQQPPNSFSLSVANELTKYGITVYPGRISNFLNHRVDSFLIFAMVGGSALGTYGIAVSVAELLWQVPSAMSLILLPNLARTESSIAIRQIRLLSQGVFLLNIIASLIIAGFAPIILPILYGEAYANAIFPLMYLLPGIVSFAVLQVIEPFFRSQNRPGIPSLAAIIGLVINIICNLLFIPVWGIAGAALASAFSYTIQTLFMAYQWHKITLQSWWTLFMPDIDAFSIRQLRISIRRLILLLKT